MKVSILKDFTQTAHYVLQQAVGEEKKKVTSEYLNSDKVKNGRAGVLARKNNISSKGLSKHAKKAAEVRWANEEPLDR